jgi:hypothetical protein
LAYLGSLKGLFLAGQFYVAAQAVGLLAAGSPAPEKSAGFETLGNGGLVLAGRTV